MPLGTSLPPLGSSNAATPATRTRQRTSQPSRLPAPVNNTQPIPGPSTPGVTPTQLPGATTVDPKAPGYTPGTGGFTSYQGYQGVPSSQYGQVGTGQTAPSYPPGSPEALIAQYQQWQDQQFASNQKNNLTNLGIADWMNQLNTKSLQQSSGADLARLMEQQYRDVQLGKEGNDLNRWFAQIGLGQADQQLGLAGQGRDLDIRGAGLNRDIGYRANLSDASSRGAITSSGYLQNDRDLLGKFNLARDTANLGYAGAELTHDRQKTDYDSTIAKAGLDDKALDSLAREYGIRASDINNQLKLATTKLGLDYAQTIKQLNDQLHSNNAQLAQQAMNFMYQMLALPDTGGKTPSAGYAPPVNLSPDGIASTPSVGAGGGGGGVFGGSSGTGSAAPEERVWVKLPNGTSAQVPKSRANDQAYLASLVSSAT